jgi:hypothetical protein
MFFLFDRLGVLRPFQVIVTFGAIWAVLLLPALLNGSPFLYYDSENYISRPMNAFGSVVHRLGVDFPKGGGTATSVGLDETEQSAAQPRPILRGEAATEDHMILRGRSIHYGIFVWAGVMLGGWWGTALLQGFLTATVILLAARRLQLRTAAAVAIAAGCALLTPAGVFVGLVMPDFLAPLTVATLALLALDPGGISARERLLLGAIAVLAMVSHTSHLALGLALVAIAGAIHAFGLLRGSITGHGVLLSLATVGLAVAISVGTDQSARRVIGVEMLNRPHLSAHLLDEGGPGIPFLDTHCTATPDLFQLCAYRNRFPVEWRRFLFHTSGEGVFAAHDIPVADRRRISTQDRAFALAVLRDRPVETLRYATAAFLEQMRRFTVEPVPVRETSLKWMRERMPDFLAAQPAARGGNVNFAMLRVIDQFAKVVSAIALVGVFLAPAMRFAQPTPTPPASQAEADRWAFGMLLLCGLVLNAAICGILASPYDRFQARVIVLLPLAAACLLASAASRRVRTTERTV